MLDTQTASPTQSAAEAPPERLPLALQDARAFEAQLAELTRGQLAALKRNAGQELPGRGTAWFYGLLYGGNAGLRLHNAETYFLIATLYDHNRLTTSRGDRRWGSMGRSMRLAADSSGSQSVKRRFQILLDADYSGEAGGELGFRLRQTIQWLGGQNVGFDPAGLLYDLSYWPHLDRFVQKKWARDFFVAPAEVRVMSPQTEERN